VEDQGRVFPEIHGKFREEEVNDAKGSEGSRQSFEEKRGKLAPPFLSKHSGIKNV
jgi:hypothetical protein